MKLQKLDGLRQSLDKKIYPYPEPEWNAINLNRKDGSTTFKQCGWCKYTGGGSCRYNCYLVTNCTLLRDYGLGSNTHWDTPCLVKMLSKEDMDDVIKGKEWDIKNHMNSIKRLEDETKLIRKTDFAVKPPLPSHRLHDYQEGEIIWIYYTKEGKWTRGVVVPGYRSHDGRVSYILDGIPKSQPIPKGECPWGCGVSVPSILRDWEYQHFKKNLDDFKVWLHLCDTDYNGERMPIKDMYSALEKVIK